MGVVKKFVTKLVKNKLSIGGSIGIHISSIAIEVIKTISSLYIFLRKNVRTRKTHHKQKPTNKTKISE